MDGKKEESVKVKVNKKESEPQIPDDFIPEGQEVEEKPQEKISESELLQKINECREKADKNYDMYLRSQAEIENIIKRNKKEKEDLIKYSNETLIKELLPVIDNLEKAISHSRDENSLQALREGVELTLKGLRDTLAKSGLTEVDSIGKPFDPNFHHAVCEQEDENAEHGAVITEYQKGYCLNQRLIRPAMVIICKERQGN